MIDNKVEIQRRLRTGELKSCNVLRLDAERLVGIEEEDFVVLEKIVHRGIVRDGHAVLWFRALYAPVSQGAA